jgi:hypothetical protein
LPLIDRTCAYPVVTMFAGTIWPRPRPAKGRAITGPGQTHSA